MADRGGRQGHAEIEVGHPVAARVGERALLDHAQRAAGRIRAIPLGEQFVDLDLDAALLGVCLRHPASILSVALTPASVQRVA